MPNIRDYESAWLSASARFEKWLAKFEQEMIAPNMELIEMEKMRASGSQEVQYGGQEEEIYMG